MKKLTFFFALMFTLSCAALFADGGVDFGGTFSNRSSVTLTDQTSLGQSNGLNLWFTAKGENLGFAARGGYSFVYDQGGDPELQHLLDFQELNFYGNYPVTLLGLSRFRFDIGRFQIKDHTRFVIDQKLDGLQLGFFTQRCRSRPRLGQAFCRIKTPPPW